MLDAVSLRYFASAEATRWLCPLDPCHPLKSVDVNFGSLRDIATLFLEHFLTEFCAALGGEVCRCDIEYCSCACLTLS